jgi:hypothetical protein
LGDVDEVFFGWGRDVRVANGDGDVLVVEGERWACVETVVAVVVQDGCAEDARLDLGGDLKPKTRWVLGDGEEVTNGERDVGGKVLLVLLEEDVAPGAGEIAGRHFE